MVAPKEESLIYGTKISSVGPGTVTGQDVTHEPSNMDLAMKLHYLKGIYYFRSPAFQGQTIMDIKEPMFRWLDHLCVACGRFRRSESGRPFIKCNDCGVRLIESHCDKTIDEWLQITDVSLQAKLLVSHQAIGPELAFSPLVLIQLTWFKCGGVSVGLCWAHVLGDAFSAVDFINMWGQFAAGHKPPRPLSSDQSHTKIENSPNPAMHFQDPLSIKRVSPVGDNWITTNNCKMEPFSFHVTATQLSHLQSKVCGGGNGNDRIPPFESLCAIIWQCVAKVRDGSEPKIVTICKNGPPNHKNCIFGNGQVISVVKADFSIIEANPKELAELVINRAVNETSQIEEAIGRDQGSSDFILYGANLTFVDMEGANFYGLEFKGQKPIDVNYTIDGVGDEGVVLVLPGKKDGDAAGRIVTIMMPENQVMELKSQLKVEFSIA
uniref:Protein ECERIFERUM 26-like n=1 Tax=Davidia involucrata TaxID=16924 RepID=A0A5B7BV86_DAVIN